MGLNAGGIGGLLGAVVGFYFGLPTLGMQVGGALAFLVHPPETKRISGPQMSDLSVQTSTYGTYIADTYGTIVVHGNVIWIENGKIKKVKRTSGGGDKKGGEPEVTTFHYYATWAVALGKGPILGGIRRIWLGTTLFYDAGSDDDETIAASNQASKLFTFYPGTDTQEPDPRMQATLGVANTPAYRGIAYLVFEDVDLKPYQNNLMSAAAKVEIIRSGTVTEYTSTEEVHPFSGLGSGRVVWHRNLWVAVDLEGDIWTSPTGKTGTWTQRYSGAAEESGVVQSLASNGEVCVAIAGTTDYVKTSYDGKSWVRRTVPAFNNLHYLFDVIPFGFGFFAVGDTQVYDANGPRPFLWSIDGVGEWAALPAPAAGIFNKVLWNGSKLATVDSATSTVWVADPINMQWVAAVTLPSVGWTFGAALGNRFVFANGYGDTAVSDDGVSWTYHATAMSSPPDVMSADDAIIMARSGSGQAVSVDGVTWTYYLFGAESSSAYGIASNGARWLTVDWDHKVYITKPRTVTSSTVSLAEIVEDQCLRSGVLESTDIITTSLTDAVRGYRIGSQGTMRSALEPLQAAFPFDVRQHGYKIEFLRRGAVGSVMTIPYDDLDARTAGAEPGARITQKIKNDAALPKRLSIQYLDPLREYDVGSQYAERPSSTAVNEEKFDLPMVLSATDAAGKCETLLYLAWLERTEVRFTLPEMVYAALEPGDVVTVESPDGDMILHLTSINTTANGVMEIVGNPYRQELFTPGALGADSLSNGETKIYAVGPAILQMLDLPHIETIQDVPGFVVAAAGTNPVWPGGTLLRARDMGVDGYKSALDLAAPGPVMAVANNALNTTVDTRVVDTASLLYVSLLSWGEYSSVSRTAMMNGDNLFAYGAHARWEIISVANCVAQNETEYYLTDFLRGRFGTEWAIPQHLEGDLLIPLDTSNLTFLQLTLDYIGVPWVYKAVTDGLSADATAARSYTYRGVAFKPISPVLLNGYRNPGTGDWDLTWVRRSRSHVRWITSVAYPLGEASEEYRIEFYTDLGYGTKVREITITSPAVTYTSAQQGTDFGGDQTTLYVKIFQISAAVGDGTPLTTSITRA